MYVCDRSVYLSGFFWVMGKLTKMTFGWKEGGFLYCAVRWKVSFVWFQRLISQSNKYIMETRLFGTDLNSLNRLYFLNIPLWLKKMLCSQSNRLYGSVTRGSSFLTSDIGGFLGLSHSQVFCLNPIFRMLSYIFFLCSKFSKNHN